MVAFMAVLWSCYCGALFGLPWLGLACATVFLGLLCGLAPAAAPARLRVALGVTCCGIVCDTALIASGVYRVPAATRWLLPAPCAPEWIVGLWLNSGAVMMERALKLRSKPIPTALVCGVFGWMIYSGAARRELVDFGGLGSGGPFVVAAVWMVLFPVLFTVIARSVERWTRAHASATAMGADLAEE